MFHINDNFCKLAESYLFSEVAKRINAYKDAHPEADIIRMGIGDVTRPLCPAAIAAMHAAVDDEADARTFHGYGPSRATHSCARLSPKTTTAPAASTSTPTRYS